MTDRSDVEQEIVRDLLRKAKDDVFNSLGRTLDLLDTPEERIAILIGVAHHVITGVAVSITHMAGKPSNTPDDDTIAFAAMIAATSGSGDVGALLSAAVAKVREGKAR